MSCISRYVVDFPTSVLYGDLISSQHCHFFFLLLSSFMLFKGEGNALEKG